MQLDSAGTILPASATTFRFEMVALHVRAEVRPPDPFRQFCPGG
jgi:hypothetical protein